MATDSFVLTVNAIAMSPLPVDLPLVPGLRILANQITRHSKAILSLEARNNRADIAPRILVALWKRPLDGIAYVVRHPID